MAYIKTLWLDIDDVSFEVGVSPSHSAVNWNKQEQGIFDAHEVLDNLILTDKNFTASFETKLNGVEFGATADQTPSEIKTAYESILDTNNYSDSEKLKVTNLPLDTNQAILDINTLLASDDTTIDELQEIVNFIKTNRSDLDTLTLANIAETVTLKHFTLTEKNNLANQSGINTGDQDLSPYVKTTGDYVMAGRLDAKELFLDGSEVSIDAVDNEFINGAFDIWQLGDTSTLAGQNTADMWSVFFGDTTGTYSKVDLSSVVGIGAEYGLQIILDAPSSIPVTQIIGQKIENPRKYHNKTLTFSTAMNSTAGMTSLNLYVDIVHANGVHSLPVIPLTITNGYNRSIATFNVGDLSALAFNVDSCLNVKVGQGVAEGYSIIFANMKLEINKTATPYKKEKINEVLSTCQRFLWKAPSNAYSGHTIAEGLETRRHEITYPVTMRVVPTVSNLTSTFGSIIAGEISENKFRGNITGVVVTALVNINGGFIVDARF